MRTLECFESILGLNMQYFADQWTRQKEMQLELIDDENHNEVQEMLERLGELEDDLKIAK